MLVLSRKKMQEIIIDENIQVVVIDVRGDRVRLGITAPSHVPIHRKEVYVRIHGDSGDNPALQETRNNDS